LSAQPAELVIGALLEVSVERLDDIDIPPSHALQRSRLVLTPFELPLLVVSQTHSELLGYTLAKGAARVQAEQREHSIAHDLTPVSISISMRACKSRTSEDVEGRSMGPYAHG